MAQILDRAALAANARRRMAEGQQRRGRIEVYKPTVREAGDGEYDLVRMICPDYLDVNTLEYPIPALSYQQLAIEYRKGKWYYGVEPASLGYPSPVEDHRDALLARGEKDAAKRFDPRLCFMALIYNYATKAVQRWEFGIMVAEQLFGFVYDKEMRELPIFWDIKGGWDLKVSKFKDNKGFWAYKVDHALRNGPLENADQVMAQANKLDLARYLQVDTEATLQGVLDGEYDWEEAKAARIERDNVEGRPIPLFLDGDKSADKSEDEPEDEPEERSAKPKTARKQSKPKAAKVEPRAPAEDGLPMGDEKPAPPPRAAKQAPKEIEEEPEESDDDSPIGRTVMFKDGDGNEYTAKITAETTTKKGSPAFHVVEDNGDEWDVAASRCVLVEEEQEADDEPEPQPAERSVEDDDEAPDDNEPEDVSATLARLRNKAGKRAK